MSDIYLTLADAAHAEPSRIRGSRFIADALPAANASQAAARLATVRRLEDGATHHCWAWRLGLSGDDFRWSDDGEPTGSAGAPILRQIEARGLTNLVVVITRYYGGTKLGTGGLMRAYGDAAAAVLDAAIIVERVDRLAVRLTFAYDDTAAAMQTLHHFEAVIAEQRYSEETELTVQVRRSAAEALLAAFTDALGGRGTAQILRA
jgi:uncharacterized YigZ family protein